MHKALVLEAIGHELRDRDERQLVLGGKHLELRPTRRCAIAIEDLADDAGRAQAGKPGKVDGGFGMSDALQHATIARAQRNSSWITCGRGRRLSGWQWWRSEQGLAAARVQAICVRLPSPCRLRTSSQLARQLSPVAPARSQSLWQPRCHWTRRAMPSSSHLALRL